MAKKIKTVYTVFKEDEDGMILLDYKSKMYVRGATKRFHNSIHLLAQASPCANLLLMYMCEKMDECNTVHVTKRFKQDFIDFLRKNTKRDYSLETIKKALTELVNLDLLINYVRVDYTVNPVYHFNGSQVQRKALIQSLLSHALNDNSDESNLKKALKL